VTLRLGTRGSALARTQSEWVADRVAAASGDPVELVVISTKGDRDQRSALSRIGGKGLFTAELESALRDRTIDFAVHSLKDLPTADPEGLVLGAIPVREDPRDGQELLQLQRAGVTGHEVFLEPFDVDGIEDAERVGSDVQMHFGCVHAVNPRCSSAARRARSA